LTGVLRPVRLVVLAGLCAGVLPAVLSADSVAQDACHVVAHAHGQSAHRHRGRPPLIVGDSTLLLATPALGRMGIESDARGCRQFAAGVMILRARRRAHTLPRLSILALGANGAIGAGDIAAALRAVGRRHVLGLVTARRSPGSTARMHAAAREHPDRVLLIDWVRHSAGHDGWFAGDGLHVGPAGARIYARFVRAAVRAFVSQPVGTLRLPRHSTTAKRCAAVHPEGRAIRVYVVRGRARITCAIARRLVRRPPLRAIAGWRFYDWSTTRDGPWSRVYVRHDHRVVVAAITHGEL
jgi:hypothetical protein